MLEPIKKLMPLWLLNKIRPLGHGFLALASAARYGFPAQKLIVIGVTGTAGKSTTIQLLAHMLNSASNGTNMKSGYITTVEYFDGNESHLNTRGMSMPSGATIQRSLAQMVKNGCRYALIEATSEGLAQNRHLGISFSMALFTNLAPAHIQSHGSFKEYMRAKGRLFSASKPHMIGANLDDTNSDYFLSFPAAVKFGVTFGGSEDIAMQIAIRNHVEDVFAAQAARAGDSNAFDLKGQRFEPQLPGKFNAHNALLAVAAANMLGVSLAEAAKALREFTKISGRMQEIPNSRGIRIFLDYAPEPLAMENSLEAVAEMPGRKKLIHVFGSTGGHRDAAKRFEFGEISARRADTIIITNDDVYDSNPEEIAKNIYSGIEQATQKRVHTIETILDRKDAITKAIELAQPGDIVLITGKGSEQFLVLPGNHRIEWDEQKVIEGILIDLAKAKAK